MRYLIAMLFAIVSAALAMLFVSGRFANWVVAKFAFDNPDQVNDLHVAMFMGANLAALLIGWAVGWMAGGAIAGRDADACEPQSCAVLGVGRKPALYP